MKDERFLSLKEVQNEISGWLQLCYNNEYKGGKERLLRMINDWADAQAVPKENL